MTTTSGIPSNNAEELATFTKRLQAVREALGMDRKEAALQIRVPEKIITMIESGNYDNSLPLTFIRGYIRSYCKLLEIPEQEVKAALDLINTEESTKPEEAVSIKSGLLSPTPSVISPSSRLLFINKRPSLFGRGLRFVMLICSLVVLFGLGRMFWQQHLIVSTHKTNPKVQLKQVAEQIPTSHPLYANVENLVLPSANLGHKLRGRFKVYPLQSLLNQLNNYLTQATVMRFELTDSTAPINQWEPINGRKEKMKHGQWVRNRDNRDPYND